MSVSVVKLICIIYAHYFVLQFIAKLVQIFKILYYEKFEE